MIIIIIIIHFGVSHTGVSRWFLSGVWVIASLLKSLGLFSVFWPISTMLLFAWSPLILLFSKFTSPCANPLVTVPRVPITIGITVTFIFHSVFNSLERSKYLSFFSLSFNSTLWSAGTAKSKIRQVLFYYYYYYYYYYLEFFTSA